MLLDEKYYYTNREIIGKGSKVLIKELGYSGFLRFIQHSERVSKENYLKLSDKVFKNTTVNEIYDNAKDYWENINK